MQRSNFEDGSRNTAFNMGQAHHPWGYQNSAQPNQPLQNVTSSQPSQNVNSPQANGFRNYSPNPSPQRKPAESEQGRMRRSLSSESEGNQGGGYKMDGIFAQSFKCFRTEYLLYCIWIVVQIAFLIYFNSSQSKKRPDSLDSLMITNTFYAVIPLGLLLLMKFGILVEALFSTRFAIQAAGRTKHGVETEPLSHYKSSFDDCVSSNIYINEADVDYDQELEPALKRSWKKMTNSALNDQIRINHSFKYGMADLLEFVMLGFAIYTLVFWFSHERQELSTFEAIFFMAFALFWIFMNWKFIGCIVLIAFLPIIIFAACIWVCFCSGDGSSGKKVELGEARNPTREEITKSGGSCSVCMMDFSETDKVVHLPCPGNHMFHEMCINGWLNIKSTCPNCRHDLKS